jgi:hypothetical protein
MANRTNKSPAEFTQAHGGNDMQTTPETNISENPRTSLTDINGLRMSGIFPKGKEPSIRTLREWTRHRRIPSHRLGHFVYYDIAEVEAHIRIKLLVPAR